ncbi:helicase-related protein [Nocardia sp. NBC_01499]|uniref:helicase-related protein n=1 Tax=Nocardia sp. NBC_01499 TaxID=2903597 RepID=UPI00386BE183
MTNSPTTSTWGVEVPPSPTDNYDLDDAVAEKNLVPPLVVDVPLKFQRSGIKYDELSDEEQEQWEAADWSADDDGVPDEVAADDLNKFLFNADTVDKMLEAVMTEGLKVDTGEHIGKTIVFARNTLRAKLIAERFDLNYPHYRGTFASIITSQADNAQSLIDKFEMPGSAPYLAISVDMLDTGLDVPAVVNLVFAKMVRSKTKFWQMLGRGTRRCDNLYGPGENKTGFVVFDLCQNVEYFNQNLPTAEGRATISLREKLFQRRADLLLELDRLQDPGETPAEIPDGEPQSVCDVRWQVAQTLHQQVAGMNPNGIEVGRKLRQVEAFTDTAAWQRITPEMRTELDQIAGLPTEFIEDGNSPQAKRFDYLLLRLQYASLTGEPGFPALKTRCKRSQPSCSARACKIFQPSQDTTPCWKTSAPTPGGKTSLSPCWRRCAGACAPLSPTSPRPDAAPFTPTSRTSSASCVFRNSPRSPGFAARHDSKPRSAPT